MESPQKKQNSMARKLTLFKNESSTSKNSTYKSDESSQQSLLQDQQDQQEQISEVYSSESYILNENDLREIRIHQYLDSENVIITDALDKKHNFHHNNRLFSIKAIRELGQVGCDKEFDKKLQLIRQTSEKQNNTIQFDMSNSPIMKKRINNLKQPKKSPLSMNDYNYEEQSQEAQQIQI